MKNTWIALLFLALPGFAQPVWSVKSSAITFKIKNAGFTVDGSFQGFMGEVVFEGGKLAESHIQASVETKTLNTGIGLRDNHLRKEDYFGAEKYPKITMKSTGFVSKGGNNYEGTFQLTIKAVTKSVSVPFAFTETGNTGIFKGSFTINRRDFGVGGNSWTISDNTTIEINLSVAKSAAH